MCPDCQRHPPPPNGSPPDFLNDHFTFERNKGKSFLTNRFTSSLFRIVFQSVVGRIYFDKLTNCSVQCFSEGCEEYIRVNLESNKCKSLNF